MGRGPGRWQRVILDALVDSEWVAIHALIPAPRTPAKRAAASRAAHTLARQGLIGVGIRHTPRMDDRTGGVDAQGRHAHGTAYDLQRTIAFRWGCDPGNYNGAQHEWQPLDEWDRRGEYERPKCYQGTQGPVVTLTKEADDDHTSD
jgi:transposase